MWFYRRIYATAIACGLLFGFLIFLRLQLGDRKPAAPDFVSNVARFRPARVCSSRALILVISSPFNAQRRQIIRETWAHPSVTQSLDISVAFGVSSADNVDSQRSVNWEAEIYGDVFQDGGDSPSRVIQLLKAARSACSPMPEFVMKTDDEVFVNTYALAELLENIETYSSSSTMWCLEWNRRLDRIGANITWVVLSSRSNDSIHPAYCLSAIYLMTGRALDAVIRRHELQSQSSRLQLPDDVYVTGVLAKEARISLLILGDRFVFDPQVEDVDPVKVAFAYLGRRVDRDTKKLWHTFVKETSNDSWRSDVGL